MSNMDIAGFSDEILKLIPGNTAVDVNLLRQASSLTSGLPQVAKGSNFGLQRPLERKVEASEVVAYRPR